MLTLTAQVVNVFRNPEGTKKDGTAFGGENKVQLQGTRELRNGQKRVELYTLTTRHPEVYEKQIGKTVQVPVGAFVAGAGIQFFITEQK